MKIVISTSIIFLLFATFFQNANAQVTVSGSTGANGTYTSLTNAGGAFAAINASAQTGNNIVVTITASSLAEAGTNSLNAGTWTTIKMYPTVSGLEISGNVAAPLINLNGADNVTIDGRVNEAGAADLIISNNNSSLTLGTSTIRFINDASLNTIKYCNLKGSSAANSLAAAGIILFSTTTGTTGNDDNTITNNKITNAGGFRPTNVIYSAGTSLKENSGNIISNNNIYDFLNPGFASNGIQLASFTTGASITGNSFYETDTFVPSSSAAYNVIYINYASANFSISNNFIGGTSPNCGSLGTVTSWTKTSGATNTFNNVFTAINVAANINASVQGNTIRNFSFANSGSASWTGISAIYGSVSIGTSLPNIIGDSTGTGSITVTCGATGTSFYGIYAGGSGTMSIENNIIGSVTVGATGPTLASNFCGIYNGASGTINNNTIGSLTTANSINATSPSSALGSIQSVYGIQNTGSRVTISGNSIANLTNGSTNTTGSIDGILVTAGSSTISYNTVKNISSANLNNAVDYLASVGGIVLNNVTAAAQTIIGNTISGLTNTNASFAGSIIGLYFNGSATANTVSGNFIHSLSAGASSTANLSGIKINAGTTTYSNNIINLSDNSTATIYGFNEAGGTNSLYFNTVYVGGSPTGALPSYALFSVTTGTMNFRNNILSNARSSASGAHYAISLAGAPLAINYNDYFTSGTGGVLGSFATVDKTTLAVWQAATTQDAASLNTDPLFAIAGGVAPANYVPAASLPGVAGTGVLVDFNESTRTSNSMGALESATAINTVDVYSGATLQASYPNLVYAFNAINNGIHTGVLTVKINGNQYLTLAATLNASGSGTASYSSVTIYPTVTGLSILGNIEGSPLIDLNGADNVTIDGRVNLAGGKDLIINNTSTSAVANTSTIRFINDASTNTIQYCVIKGAETSTTSGVLFFSTTNRATGNDGNLIANNDLTSSTDLARPLNVIYSAGLVGTGFENSGNIVNANNIYDFFSRTGAQSNGVSIFASSTGWTVSGNSFFETTSFAPTATVEYNPIYIRTGGAFDITGNYIGGSSAACGGAAWNKTASNTNAFFGINYFPSAVSATTLLNIQGNTIQNFDYKNLGSNSWTGIFIGGGIAAAGSTINIGTTSPNIIGAATGVNSIIFTSGATNPALQGFYGINLTNTANYYYQTVNIQNNIIGAITVANTFASGASNFWGIYKTVASSLLSEVTNITGNTIGSMVTGSSINASTASNSAQTVYGIWTVGNTNFTTTISGNTIANMNNASVGATAVINGITVTYLGASATTNTGATNIITGNTIRDLTAANANATASNSGSVTGIAVFVRSTAAKIQTVTGNTIYNLTNTNSAFAGYVMGIYFGGSTGLSNVSNNLIHSLSITGASSTTGKLAGIYRAAGAATFSNNIITLGGNSASYVYGIFEFSTAGITNQYFNTINISGNPSAGAATSYALYSLGTLTLTRDYRNNLYINTRSNSGAASGTHYAIYTAALPAVIDNNDYFVSGTGGQLGLLGATNALTLVDWKTATGNIVNKDLNSVSINPLFTTPGGTSAIDYFPSASLPSVTGTGILTDYFATSRVTTLKMGALESGTCTNPTNGGTIAVNQSNCGSFDPTLINSTSLSTGYIGTLEYQWQSSTDNITFTDIPGAITTTYDPGVLTQTTWFKRLARVNCMADWTGAAASNVVKMTVDIAPTPSNAGADQTQLNLGSFTLSGNAASVGTGTWAVVRGTATIITPNSETSTVTGVPAGSTTELSWTITNGLCSTTDNVILVNTALTGNFKVGPTGTFPSLTNALQVLQANGFTGGPVILELQSTYLSSVETFPISFTSALLTSASNTLTIRPELGATGLSINSGLTVAHTLNFDNVTYITIDGRPGGTGTTSELTVNNGLVNDYTYNAIRLASSSNNTFSYCHITSSNTTRTYSPWTAGATIWFVYNSNGLFQNYNNTIDNCFIHGTGNDAAGIAGNLMNILGSPNTTITNNKIYDFGTKGSSSSFGLQLGSSDGSTVTGNSFYQTAARNVSYGANFISLNGGVGYNVSGNYIGGSAPLCAGTPMVLSCNYFYATLNVFNIAIGNTAASEFQGNIVQNIQANLSDRCTITVFNQSMGKVNIGTTTPNIIGSQTDPTSISIVNNSANTESSFNGLVSSSGSAIDFTTFSNNNICGISLTGNGMAFNGINAGAFYTQNLVITNNIIGSATLANAINNATTGKTIGIAASGRYLNTITGNTVANLTQSNPGASGQLIGIAALPNSGVYNISGNSIYKLSSSSTSAGTGATASVTGISLGLYNGGGQNITGNIIHSLSNTSLASAPSVIGIYYPGVGGANTISDNNIRNLSLLSSSPSASITGIYVDNTASVAKFVNNMIALGFDATGTALNTGYNIRGIYDSKGSNSFYNNTVYIGGTSVAGTTSNTYAYISDVITNTRAVQNNIFMNSRSGGTSGLHYAVAQAGIIVSPTGLTSSHNLYFTSGTNGMLGRYNGVDRATLVAWQSALGLDNGSINADPSLMNPAGDATTTNLHILSPTPVEGAGTFISFVTTDFDGEMRSSFTPNDIGADAGNFTATADLTAPSIVFVPIPATHATTSMVLTGFASITDNVAVSSGANAPRIYYKKLTDTYAFGGNTSANNGWKFTLATNTTSPYDFTIDYSLINGGIVSPGDIIQYFVVAQDAANNLSSNFNGAASSATTDPIQSINASPPIVSINQYQVINDAFSGIITVPGNYSTLTGPSGLFQAINEGTVAGDVNVLITDNLIEPGTYALNEFAAPYTLTIAPAGASLKTITANIDNGLIRFFGADRVTIDGRFNGSGKYLEFYNSGTASYLASTFLFTNMANNNTIQYVNIKGQNPLGSVVKFEGIYPNTGNSSNNTIDHCDISGTGSVVSLISSYSNVGGANTLNRITSCNLFDFYHPTNSATAINLSYGSSDWTITGNSFYQTTGHSTTGGLGVIQVTDGTNHLISGNFIGGSAPLAGGTPWTSSIANYMRIIYCFNNNGPVNMDITNNTITNMDIFSTSANGWSGIDISSAVGAVSGNTIGSISAANALVITGTSFTGIQKIGTASMNIENNHIGGVSATTGIYGIITSGNAATNINFNTIGSTTIANSINSEIGQITGIAASHNVACSFSDNTIANLTSGTGIVKGMQLTQMGFLVASPYTIERNIIRNLSGGSTAAGTSVLGMFYTATGSGGIISQNQIDGLHNTALTGSGNITGLYLGSTSGSVLVARNDFHDFTLATADITAAITGIHINGFYSGVYQSYTNATIQNNLIRLGEGVTAGYAINGIFDEVGISSLYFNTVVLNGTLTGNTSDTYALNSSNTNGRDYRNNIFANNRSGGDLGSGDHYVIKVAGTGAAQAGLNLNYNDYYAGMALTEFKGFFNGLYVPDFTAWKLAVGLDANSINADPLFTSTTNLIPLAGSPVIGAGTPVGGVTLDLAGTTRVAPHTMGAYEWAACTNPTVAGTIAANQNGCSPFDAAQITSTLVASGESGILEYKWQYAVAPFTTWIDLASSNSATYDPATITVTTMYRRLARVTCKADWVAAAVSNAVTMTVNPVLPVSLTIAATATTVCAGTTVTYTATPVNPGANPVYQWKKNSVNVGTNSPTYAVIPTNGNTITCVLTSDATPCATGSPATSNTITMVVNVVTPASITIFEFPSGAVCEGASKNFFASISNGGTLPIYQWKVNGSNVGTNANNFSYAPANNDIVTCELISNATCFGTNPAVSNAFTMAVNSNTVNVSIAANQTIVCAGTSVIFTATPFNGGITPTYQWYNGATPVGTNSATYAYTPAPGNTDAITVQMTPTASSCVAATPATSSPAVTIMVDPVPAADFSAGSVTTPLNSTVTFSDLSTGTITGWTWSFSPSTVTYVGGTTANSQNPQVQFTAGGSYTVTLSVTSGVCSNAKTKVDYIHAGTPGKWIGLTSTDWNTSSNWEDNLVPGPAVNILIPATAVNWPTFTGNLSHSASITLSGVSSNLTITGDFTLLSGSSVSNTGTVQVKGNLSNQNVAITALGSGTFTFNGAAPQTISGLNKFGKLALINTSGLSLSNDQQIDGVLTLTSGLITLGANNLTLGIAATIAGSPSASSMVVATGAGLLRKEYGAIGSFTFPVGDNTGAAEYSPVTLNFTAGTFAADANAGVSLVNAAYPDPSITGNYLNRYWNVTQSGITGFSCNALFNYVPADVTGTENSIYTYRMAPSPFTQFSATNLTLHQLSASGVTSFGSFTGANGFKNLVIKLYLEGLYNGAGTMLQAQGDLGNQFAGSVADKITVELHDPLNYLNIIATIPNVDLNTTGLATMPISLNYSGSYYLTVKNRNSIETVSAAPIAFSSSSINYDFSVAAAQAFGSNQKTIDGVSVIYGGDANGDGVVDGLDLILVENDANLFSGGYLLTDLNGDGAVDGLDLILAENNANGFVSTIHP